MNYLDLITSCVFNLIYFKLLFCTAMATISVIVVMFWFVGANKSTSNFND